MGGRRAWLYILGIVGVVKFGLKRLRDTATDREMSTRTQELLSEAADVVEHAETRYLNELRAQDTVQILRNQREALTRDLKHVACALPDAEQTLAKAEAPTPPKNARPSSANGEIE